MILDPKIKLLQLRKIMTNPGLIITIDGPLLSKGGRRAKLRTKSVANQIQKATKIFNWQSPPRARIAVSFRFLSNQHNPPEVYNLIKYYLDLLQGPVFKEDRQVHYLDASIWRSKTKGKNDPSRLYIHVRRLKDYLQMLDLCEEDEDFNYRDDNHIVFYHYIDKNHWDEAKRQCDFLSSSRIMLYDLPRQKNPIFSELAQDFNEFHPLVFNFGSLPKRGQSQYFQNVIASSFSELVSNYSIFKHMIVPIEFDVQVTKAGLKLAKDLDNIVITICSEVRKQVLSPNFYVNGYRVYVVDKLESNINSGIQVKILPPGEIESYNERIKKSLERLEDDLEQRV